MKFSSIIEHSEKNQRLLLACIFLICISVILVFLLFFKHTGPAEHEIPGSDYEVIYKPMADNLLAGKGIPLAKGMPVSAPPGYAFFLAPMFILARTFAIDEVSFIVFANAIIAGLASCFLFLLIRQTFNRNVALLATALWISYPLHLWFIKNPNTEVPFLLPFFIALWLSIKSIERRSLGLMFSVGILLGISILIRPFVLFLPIFLIFFPMILWRKQIPVVKFSLALLIGTIVTISPWVVYASSATSRFVLVSSAGVRTAATGLSFAFVGNGKHQYTVPEDVRLLMMKVRHIPMTTTKEFATFITHELATQPVAMMKLLALKFVRSWYATYGMWWEKQLLLLQLPYIASALLGIYYVFRQKKIFNTSLLLTVILYFWAMTFATLSIVRYMVPVMSLVLSFSAFGIITFSKPFLRESR